MNEMAASCRQLYWVASFSSGTHQVVQSPVAKIVQRFILPITFTNDALLHIILDVIFKLLTDTFQKIILIILVLLYLDAFFIASVFSFVFKHTHFYLFHHRYFCYLLSKKWECLEKHAEQLKHESQITH